MRGGSGLKKPEKILPMLCIFLFGVILGFIASPIKKGIEIGNNSGNTTNNHYNSKEEQEISTK
jgi:hypothetical protein